MEKSWTLAISKPVEQQTRTCLALYSVWSSLYNFVNGCGVRVGRGTNVHKIKLCFVSILGSHIKGAEHVNTMFNY